MMFNTLKLYKDLHVITARVMNAKPKKQTRNLKRKYKGGNVSFWAKMYFY